MEQQDLVDVFAKAGQSREPRSQDIAARLSDELELEWSIAFLLAHLRSIHKLKLGEGPADADGLAKV